MKVANIRMKVVLIERRMPCGEIMLRRRPHHQIVLDRWVRQMRAQGHTVEILRPSAKYTWDDCFWCILDVSGTISSFQWDIILGQWV